MGLDMYLSAKKYINKYDWNKGEEPTPNPLFETVRQASGFGNHKSSEDFATIVVEYPVAYWRKANAIHKWFMALDEYNDDNIGDVYVTRENLKELKRLCMQVLFTPSKADELLPTEAGFFFGSTEYDEWYLEKLKDTIEQINGILDANDDDGIHYIYSSSW